MFKQYTAAVRLFRGIRAPRFTTDTVLSKAYEILLEKNNSIVKIMQKIEDIKKSVDFLPNELKSCFERVLEFTKCLTIEPSSIEFLQPYLNEDQLLNIIE